MRTIRHHVDLQARTQPDAPYLIAPETGRVMTYSQLKSDSEQLGRYLLGQGLVQGDKVALCVNGAAVSEIPGIALRKGHVGFEGEGHEIAFRNIKLKTLP